MFVDGLQAKVFVTVVDGGEKVYVPHCVPVVVITFVAGVGTAMTDRDALNVKLYVPPAGILGMVGKGVNDPGEAGVAVPVRKEPEKTLRTYHWSLLPASEAYNLM